MRTAFLDLLTRAARLPINDLWNPLLAEWLAEMPEFIAIGVRLERTVPETRPEFHLLKPVSADTLRAMLDWGHAFDSTPPVAPADTGAGYGLSPDGTHVMTLIAPFVFRNMCCGCLVIVTQPLSREIHLDWMRFTERLADLLFSRHLNHPRSQTVELDDPRAALEFLADMQRMFAPEPVGSRTTTTYPTFPEPWHAESETRLGGFLRRFQTAFSIESAFVMQRVSDEHVHILAISPLVTTFTPSATPDTFLQQLPGDFAELLTDLSEAAQLYPIDGARLTLLPGGSQSTTTPLSQPTVQSFPCQVAGETFGHLGVLMIRRPDPGSFLRLMTLISNHLGFWFAHQYRLRREADRSRLRKQINMTFNVITGSLEVEGIYDQLCDNLRTLFGQEHGAVAAFSASHELEIVRRFGTTPAGFDPDRAVKTPGIVRDYIADGSAFGPVAADSDEPVRFVFPLSPTPQVTVGSDDIFHQRALGGVILYNAPGNRPLGEDLLEMLNSLLNGFSAALRVSLNYREKLETIEELEGLIAQSDDQDRLLSKMIDVIQKLLKVKRISYLTLNPDGRTLSIKDGRDLPPGVIQTMQIPLGEGISGYVASTGETLRLDNIEETATKFQKRSLEHYFNRSLLSVPLVSKGPRGETEVLGVINVNNKINGLTFTKQDQQMLESLAHLVVAALTNINLLKTRHENDLLQLQLTMAKEVQTSLLPKVFDSIPSQIGMYGRSDPARQIGGDFYDGLPLADGRWFAAIGDVSGKGMSAAILMATTRIILRSVVQTTSDPTEILRRVHQQLGRELDGYFFVTMQAVAIDPMTGDGEMVSAGHGPLLACLGGSLTQLECKGGFPLNVGGNEAAFDAVQFRLIAGDRLLFFTDGLTEDRAPTGEMFGMDRTCELFGALRDRQAKQLVEEVFAAAEAWRSEGEAHDDLTVMAVEYIGVTE
ncbi:MAG TPA: SpoIIE family protein phosphatase [Candidatus Ozemobacteraceae bacterium]|nr:SpoIIE family protein phosphatase [Candidatus Ozemobacteraceae bacterium]